MKEDLVPFDFSQKLTALQKPLYAYILSLLPNKTEAEDVLQETNLILCKKSNEYDPEGHFQGWAFNIARFQVMGHISKFKRSKLCFSPELVETLAEEVIDLKDLDLSRKALQICYELLPKHMKPIATLRFREDTIRTCDESKPTMTKGKKSLKLHNNCFLASSFIGTTDKIMRES